MLMPDAYAYAISSIVVAVVDYLSFKTSDTFRFFLRKNATVRRHVSLSMDVGGCTRE